MDRAFLSAWLSMAGEEDIQRGSFSCPPTHSKGGFSLQPNTASNLPAAQPNGGGQRGAKAVNSFEPPRLPHHSPQTPCPQEMMSCPRQKEMREILCAYILLPRWLWGRGPQPRGGGGGYSGPLFRGVGWLEHGPTAHQGGPRWAKDYRGPAALPQTSPPFSPSFSAGYRPGL